MAPELEQIAFETAAAWRAWLERNHDSSSGVWLLIAKKGTGVDTVSYEDAIEEALCFGWIDGQRQRHDDTYFQQRFTRRVRRSPWSKINTERATRLIAEKRMQPAGAREVEAAKADGRWDAAYAGQATSEVPDDLQRALDGSPTAAAAFATLARSTRYSILYRINAVKKPETRSRKIADYVAKLEQGAPLP